MNIPFQTTRNKAVDICAAQLPGEYRREAVKVDQELGFINGDGPTLRKLLRYPPVMDLCFGAYGKCSDGVKIFSGTDATVLPKEPWLEKWHLGSSQGA